MSRQLELIKSFFSTLQPFANITNLQEYDFFHFIHIPNDILLGVFLKRLIQINNSRYFELNKILFLTFHILNANIIYLNKYDLFFTLFPFQTQ